ncbi:anthrax toxin lethal factor-related metalloendopeptidase [Mangrovibacillus cuniculi]|uniref:Toxin n=1 Tax=Mangrovibacillus cuniculi TaxID=2593652 RepID=A0A7S8CAY8_9BACI|nr:toxin [Mangrovibacillus cuniculi]QPC46623.1 toxin [Mangrovibacillus cuniculi]
MDKRLLVLLLLGTFLMSGHERTNPKGLILHESIYYHEMNLRSDWPLKQMIYVPVEKADSADVNQMVQTIDKIPARVLRDAYNAGLRIHFFQGKLTQFPSTTHLENLTPRGYENTETTWDDVPGIGGGKVIYAKVGHSDKGEGHGSVNLELHEFAHSLDNYLFTSAWHHVTQYESWKSEASILFPNKRYFIDYQSEFFAESFAYFYHSEDRRMKLKEHAPKMYDYLTTIDKGEW